jgi:glycine hydroxymethyltransferase
MREAPFIRIGTIEVTWLGLREAEMEQIADFIARVVVEHERPAEMAQDVAAFRQNYQTLSYCFDHGLPPKKGRAT